MHESKISYKKCNSELRMLCSLKNFFFYYRYKKEVTSSKQTHEIIIDNGQNQRLEIELRHNKRLRLEKSFGPNFYLICWKVKLKTSNKL